MRIANCFVLLSIGISPSILFTSSLFLFTSCRIRMDAIVDLRQLPLRRPPELRLLGGLEALIIPNEVQLELWRHPRSKLKGDIFLGVCSTVAAGLRHDASCIRLFDP